MNRTLFAAALLLAAGPAAAATIAVTRFDDPPVDGCSPADCSVREAVAHAMALPGADTIQLSAGAYVLREPGPGEPLTLSIEGALSFEGAGPDQTRVYGNGRGSLFRLYQANVAFHGLTLRDGRSAGSDVGGLGGGAIRADQSQLLLEGARLEGNTSQFDGGALHLTDSVLELVATSIRGNKAANGGGAIWAQRTPVRLRAGSSLTFNGADSGGAFIGNDEFLADDDCSISDNTAQYGGAFVNLGGRLTVRGVATKTGSGLLQVAGNEASGAVNGIPSGLGGAFFGSEFTLERLSVTGNQASYGGGAIYLSEGDLVMKDSRIDGNRAGLVGGGAALHANSVLLERVSLDGNSAGDQGGAMLLSGDRKMLLRNVDFHDNQAQQHAAVVNGAPLTLSHVSFWNNLSATGADVIHQHPVGSAFYSNSLVLGRCTGTAAAIGAAGRNVRAYERTDACSGVLHLQPLALARGSWGGLFEVTGISSSASPLVDAGSALYCTSRDVRNGIRDRRCDVGAFEHGTAAGW